MPVNEKLVQDIVQEVMAKMQIAEAPAGKHGIFKDMNDAIEAAGKAEQVVRRMSMDQREKIITVIRRKIRENAEVLARMGVDETGMGNVGDKIIKHVLVADKTPGTDLERGQRPDTCGDGPLWRYRRHHAIHQPQRNGALQHHRNAGRRQYGCIQSTSGCHKNHHLCDQPGERSIPGSRRAG